MLAAIDHEIISPFILGFITSIIAGYLAIHLVLTAIRQRKLTVFSIYTWVWNYRNYLVYFNLTNAAISVLHFAGEACS